MNKSGNYKWEWHTLDFRILQTSHKAPSTHEQIESRKHRHTELSGL